MPNVESYGWKTVLSPKLLTIVEQNVTASNILIVPEYLSKVLFENVIYKYHHNIIDKLIVVRDNKQKLNSKWLHALKCESWDKINCTLPTLLCPTCFSPMKHSRNSKMKTIPITSNKKMKGPPVLILHRMRHKHEFGKSLLYPKAKYLRKNNYLYPN